MASTRIPDRSPADNGRPGSESEAQQLRRQMAQVRHELRDDVDEVVEQAKELTDWRHYVREYPFACIGVAAAVGFLVVPNKIRVMSPTASQLEELAKRDHLIVKPSPGAGVPGPSWKSKAITFGANMLLRAAIAYAGQKFGEVVEAQSAGDPAHHDA